MFNRKLKYMETDQAMFNHILITFMLLTARTIILFTTLTIRDGYKNYIYYSDKIWIGYFLMYMAIWTFFFDNVNVFNRETDKAENAIKLWHINNKN